MAYEVYIPVISAVVFSANPAVINAKITLTVTVKDSAEIREPDMVYSGEIRAGEV